MSINSMISITEFTKTYDKKVIHFKTLSINHKVTIFIGENGSGKSTILKAIVNLISYQGNINSDFTYSYMPEHPAFPINITVKQFLLNLYQIFKNDYDYHCLLTDYGLETRLNDEISTLSKGMKAKLNLIQCLMRNTDVYILDEPLGGLDDQSVKKLIKYIKNSPKNYIISTHIKDAFQDLDKEVIYINEVS